MLSIFSCGNKNQVADDSVLNSRNDSNQLQKQLEEANAKIAMLEDSLAKIKESDARGGTGYAAKKDDGGSSLSGLLRKVNHVSRICSDAERSKEFYADLLGAKVLNRPNFPAPGYWLWLGNVQLHLIQGEHANIEASHAPGIATGHVNHISFEVHDFDAVEAKLKALDVKYTKNLVPEGNDVIHQLFLADPDGHYIEICDCDRFSDFVFGEKPDPGTAKRLAAEYLEGADLLGATVAAAAALCFVPGKVPGVNNEEDFEESVTSLHRAFKLISGGKEFIEVVDWAKFLNRMGHQATPKEVSQVVGQIDEDKNGKISFPEFAKVMLSTMKAKNDEKSLKQSFRIIDRDNDGKVTKDELLLMLWGTGQRMDEAQLAEAIDAADKDKDGEVDWHEFLALVKDKL